MLDQIIAERWVTPKATVGLWRCKREGDDILVLAGNDGLGFPFFASRLRSARAEPNMSPADFINPDGEDWIGGFAVGIHGLEPHLERFKTDHRRLLRHLAEGARRPAWRRASPRCFMPTSATGCGAMRTSISPTPHLIREKYRGIRPAPGYPACPDHSLKPVLFEHARRQSGRSHADREFRDASDLGRVGLLFRTSRQPVFRRRADRSRPARRLCDEARCYQSNRRSAG